MNSIKIDYNRVFENTVKSLNCKKRLLLHTCCAPCSGAVLERVTPFFDVTLFFFNPNIDSETEYYKRAEQLEKLSNRFKLESVIVPQFEPQCFFSSVKGQENSVEGGARCETCITLRLDESAKICERVGADFFATTLTVSPHKNAAFINIAGEKLSTDKSVYLPSDFKKKEGYKRSIAISNELELYRQSYCGCGFSKRTEE